MAKRITWRNAARLGGLLAVLTVVAYLVTLLRPVAAEENGDSPPRAVAIAGDGSILVGTSHTLMQLPGQGGARQQLLTGHVTHLFVDPGAPSEWYAAGPELGVVRSPDSGRTWTRVPGHGLPAGPVLALGYDPSAARRLIAAVGGQGIYQSDNGGDEWMQLSEQVPPDIQSLAVSPLDARVFLAGTPHGLYVSTNQGMRFDPVAAAAPRWAPVPLAGPVYALAVAGDRSAMLAATGDALQKSVDGGRAWTRLADPGLPDVVAVAVDPDSRHTLVAASRSGSLAVSSDGGTTWQSLSEPRAKAGRAH